MGMLIGLTLVTSSFAGETYKYECYSTHYGTYEWDPANAYLKAQFTISEEKASIKVDYNKSTSMTPKNWRLNAGETIVLKPLTQSMVPAWRKLDTDTYSYFTGKNIGNAIVEINVKKYYIGSNEITFEYNIEAIPATKDDPASGTNAFLICREK